jgi:beta-glucosidase
MNRSNCLLPIVLIALISPFWMIETLAGDPPKSPATQPTSRPADRPTTDPAPTTPRHSAVSPAPRTDEGWVTRNNRFNEQVKKGNFGMIFLGDSITQGWEDAGRDVWAKFYAPRKAINLGIGGDGTQHVLWRLQNGNLDGLDKPAGPGQAAPRLVVLMIGTNNSNAQDNTAKEIADGITAIVGELRQKLPKAKVLLLGIFPRGEKPGAQRAKIDEVNRLIATLADGKIVHYLDIGPKFLQPDGTISPTVMPDFLHLSPKGYEIWAESIEPKLKELLETRE